MEGSFGGIQGDMQRDEEFRPAEEGKYDITDYIEFQMSPHEIYAKLPNVWCGVKKTKYSAP